MSPSLFNFILYCEDKVSYQINYPLVEKIQLEFPCKIFLLYRNLDPLDCHNFQPSDELLSLDMLDPQDCMIAIYEKLKTDLPIYLFWGGNLLKDQELFKLLLRYTDRLIIDSEHFFLFERTSKLLEKCLRKKNLEVCDLSWTRLQGWRELLFQLYSTELPLEKLTYAKEISIHYNYVPQLSILKQQCLSLLLLGWLASKLHWRLKSSTFLRESVTLIYKHQKGICTILTNKESCSQLPPGSLLHLRIEALDGSRAEMFRKDDSVLVHLYDLCYCSIPFYIPLRSKDHSKSFFRSLLYFFEKNAYKNALQSLPREIFYDTQDEA